MSSLGDLVGLDQLLGGRRSDRIGVADGQGAGEGMEAAPRIHGDFAKRMQEAQLLRTIESEIVPRLLLTYSGGRSRSAAEQRQLGVDDIAEFTRILVAHDTRTARSFIEAMRTEGVSIDSIRMDLVAPAARLLGELWHADRCTFAEVSIALCRVHQVLRELGTETRPSEEGPSRGRVVLSPVPGEQHSLGVLLLAEMLRDDGWEVTQLFVPKPSELLDAVSEGWIEMVGLSVSNDALLGVTERLVRELRQTTRNPSMAILVGGACFCSSSEGRTLGADGTGSDARDIVRFMRERASARAPRPRS